MLPVLGSGDFVVVLVVVVRLCYDYCARRVDSSLVVLKLHW